MREFVLHREQTLRAPIRHVFAFFSDAGNLEQITPPFVQFHILTPRPIEMWAGTIIDYSLRLHGIGFKWRSEITAWEPPTRSEAGRFVDEERKGPYRYWIHEHRFEPRAGAGRLDGCDRSRAVRGAGRGAGPCALRAGAA